MDMVGGDHIKSITNKGLYKSLKKVGGEMEDKRIKYTVGAVQQEKLMKYGLDIKDAYILSYLKDINQLKNIVRKQVNGKIFMWVEYEKIIKYLPIININKKDTIYRRLRKYENLGLVTKYLHKNEVFGTYTFFHLEDTFFDLFEISNLEDSEEEMKETMKNMGIAECGIPIVLHYDRPNNEKNDESPVEFLQGEPSVINTNRVSNQGSDGNHDSNRIVTPSQRRHSVHSPSRIDTPSGNTPINTPNNTKAVAEDKPAATFEETFFKNLKDLLVKNNFKNHNSQTLKNINNFSKGDINQVKKAIGFMISKNKAMNSKVLVAILKDKDYLVPEIKGTKKAGRAEKIKMITQELGVVKVSEIREKVLKSMGFDGKHIDDEVGNILCRKFNELYGGK